MNKPNLKDLVTALVEARAKLTQIEEEYEAQLAPLKEAKKHIELDILNTFKERGEQSARIDNTTASVAVRKTPKIVDERVLVNNLKEKGLDTYLEERVSDLFKETILKNYTGEEQLKGIDILETEYLTIRTKQ